MRTKDLFTSPINIILLSIVAITAFYFSMNSPWTGDDMMYGYKITEEYVTNYRNTLSPDFVPERIESFGDLIDSQNNHFFLVNGRYVAHILVQIFCSWLGPVAFSICNVAVWLALIYLILYFSGRKRIDWRFLSISLILVYLTFVFKAIPSTQIGYVWVATIDLFFLKLFFEKNHSRYLILPLFIISLIAGNGNESFSSGICVALLVYFFRNFRRFSTEKWIMLIGYCVGALILIISPGSWHRVGTAQPMNAMNIMAKIITGTAPLIILLGVVSYKIIRTRKYRVIFSANYFWWTAFGICMLFVIISGSPSSRSFCGTYLMAIIITLRNLRNDNIKKIWLGAGLIAVLLIWSVGYENLKGQKALLQRIEREYTKSENGEVYADIFPSTPLISNIETGVKLGLPSDKEYWFRILKLHFRTKYHTDKELRIYPTFLEGKDSLELENQVVEVHPGVFLVIVKDGTKPTVNIKRGLDFGLFSIPYDTYTPTLTTPIKEGKNWKAYMVYDDMYLISNLNADIDGNQVISIE